MSATAITEWILSGLVVASFAVAAVAHRQMLAERRTEADRLLGRRLQAEADQERAAGETR